MGCFYCRLHTANPEWHVLSGAPRYLCRAGLTTAQVKGIQDVLACEKGDVQFGFQIGGYYRHMWFDGEKPVAAGPGWQWGGALTWHIQGDDEFPHQGHTEFDLSDWQQLEQWVAFWGPVLRQRGWVVDEPDDEQAKE